MESVSKEKKELVESLCGFDTARFILSFGLIKIIETPINKLEENILDWWSM